MTLRQLWIAGRLRILASGEIDLTDEATLAKAVELLDGFSSAQRQEIADKAVELGADAAVITTLVNLATGEVIEVGAKAPTRRPWWLAATIGGALAVGIGGAAGLRARRGRRLYGV